MKKKIQTALNNNALRTALGNFADAYPRARANVYQGIDFEALRHQIQTVKANANETVEELADLFEQNLTANGAHVHRAADGQAVASIISQIAQRRGAKLCVKSKSMTSEEIHLNHRLEETLDVVETDLGEWIIQQIQHTPSHMVMPAIHLSRQQCAEIFSRVTGKTVEPDIPHMVKLAREILRTRFLDADIGITGCNIAVAETGTMVIFTNEGNGRLTATLPPVHVVLLGYEKLVRCFGDIAPLAAALPRNATCQPMTSYITMISGPSETLQGPQGAEVVPKELHVILLDNGRLELLKNPVFKSIGQCIRCASCLNVCPVYGLVGGQVYGDIYSGGIGALLTAFLANPKKAEKIQELCLSCGKCREFCPGKIDIPGLLLKLRGDIRREIPPPFLYRTAIQGFLPHKKIIDISLKVGAPVMRYLRTLPVPPPAPRFFSQVCQGIEQKIEKRPGEDEKQRTVAFFYGCLIDYFYPEIGRAVVALLNRAGCRVVFPRQKCCGAPALYTGLEKSAARMVRQNLEYFNETGETVDHVVSACPTGTLMFTKHRQSLLPNGNYPDAEKAVDFIRLLHMLYQEGRLPLTRRSDGNEIKVTYHYSCHLKRDSGIEDEPRQVISALPGVRWVEMEEADRCCGFAGTYSTKLPEISAQLLERKIKNIERSGADIVLVDCPGCLTWLRRGLENAKSTVHVFHSASFLVDASGGSDPF